MIDIDQLPEQIKDDIEDQSLDILQQIQKYVVVIGGWAVFMIFNFYNKSSINSRFFPITT